MTLPIASKPDAGSEIAVPDEERLNISEQYQAFLDDVEEEINSPNLPEFTVAQLSTIIPPALTPVIPASSRPNGMVMASDEVGGKVPAFSDGTDWRRVTDRAIIST